MRRPKPFVAALCVACFLLSPGRVDGQSFGDSSLTSAVNTYLEAEAPKEPSEALELLLAGAAAGARVAFALECRRQLNQLLQEQLQMEPGSDRYRRIEDRMDRLQSAASAATGDFRALRATGARTQAPIQPATPTASRAAASPESEEEQNLEEQLRSFRARVESLMEKHRTRQSQLAQKCTQRSKD
ncbi:MAG: hypothetical protein U5J83_18740 [Bryobacterales bacterium]|nr:hypothetical protein [Bryobacterales bacterium]